MGIVFRNTSPLTWSAQQGYSLAVIDDAGGLFQGVTNVSLPEGAAVIFADRGIVNFVANIRAPEQIGVHSAHVRMIQLGSDPFGEIGEISLEVAPPQNGARDWAAYE